MFYYLIISTEFGTSLGHHCPSSGHYYLVCIVCLMAPKNIYLISSSFKQCGFVTSTFFFIEKDKYYNKKNKDFTKGQRVMTITTWKA